MKTDEQVDKDHAMSRMIDGDEMLSDLARLISGYDLKMVQAEIECDLYGEDNARAKAEVLESLRTALKSKLKKDENMTCASS